MKAEESSQSAELNSYHGDINPGFGAGLGSFVITDQSPLAHQPAEGAFHDPTARQYGEAGGIVGAFDDRDRQFGAESLDPLSKRLPGVAAIHPQEAQPSKPTQHPAQNQLCSVAFRGAGRTHGHAEHQSQSIHQQMALAAFDPFAGVIANLTAVARGFDTLTVQNGRRGSAALAVSFPDQRAQGIVERGPLVVLYPLPKNVVNRFPMRKISGQITPRTATLDEIQDGIKDAPPVNRWASAFGRNWEHRFEVSPLGIREAGVIYGVFHAPTEAALKIGRQTPSRMSTHTVIICSLAINHPSQPQHSFKN